MEKNAKVAWRECEELKTLNEMSICHDACAVQKRLNGSRSYLGWRLSAAQGTMYLLGGPDPSTATVKKNSMRPSLNYFGRLFTDRKSYVSIMAVL